MSEQARPKTRILLFQTEVADCVSDAADQLRRPGRYPEAEILLLCSESDREAFEATGKFERILTYSRRGGLRHLRFLRSAIKKFDPDISSAVFSGRPIFRKPKLVFFILAPSTRYVFDARMEGYRLRLQSFKRLFLQDREAMARYSEHQTETSLVLFIETESRDAVERAIETAVSPDVVPNARILLFCGRERAPAFEGNPNLTEIRSYTKESPIGDLRTAWQMFCSRPDVVAAIFSGRRVFMKQKILFWLLPARARLAFNENNDCAYVSRWNALRFVRIQPPETSVDLAAGQRLVRPFLKGILFVPRFAYLLAWVTFMKLLRAYRLDRLARYTSPKSE